MSDDPSPVPLEDAYAQALEALRSGQMRTATPLIEKIATACGTTAGDLIFRFVEVASDPTGEEEFLDDLQTMGALTLTVKRATTGTRRMNFAIPSEAPAAAPTATRASPASLPAFLTAAVPSNDDTQD